MTGKLLGTGKVERPVNATTLVMRIPGLHHSAAQGALSVVRAATDPDARSGAYFGPARNFEVVGPPRPARVPKAATDPRLAHDLWERAVLLTGAEWPDRTAPGRPPANRATP